MEGEGAAVALCGQRQEGAGMKRPSEITFEVTEAVEGGYDARAQGYGIFTQGDSWEELEAMAQDAALCHFDEEDAPGVVRLHLV